MLAFGTKSKEKKLTYVLRTKSAIERCLDNIINKFSSPQRKTKIWLFYVTGEAADCTLKKIGKASCLLSTISIETLEQHDDMMEARNS